MLRIEHDTGWDRGCIILRPHPPSSWRANLWIAGLAALLCLSFAIGFALAGAWLILPFAGIEIMALFGLLYYVSLKSRVQEVVQFDNQEIRFQRGRRRPVQEWHCPRYGCRLHVTPPAHPWYSSQVSLRCHGEEVELGRFLSDRDKRTLVRNLSAFLPRG